VKFSLSKGRKGLGKRSGSFAQEAGGGEKKNDQTRGWRGGSSVFKKNKRRGTDSPARGEKRKALFGDSWQDSLENVCQKGAMEIL